MLKTNSKKAIENIKKYICDNVNFDYDTVNEKYYYVMRLEERNAYGENIDIFSVYAYALYYIMYDEVVYLDNRGLTMYEYFTHWCEGLPGVLNTGYYLNRSAVQDLGDILEQTEAERSKYTESEAEKKITYLMWREIYKVVSKGARRL